MAIDKEALKTLREKLKEFNITGVPTFYGVPITDFEDRDDIIHICCIFANEMVKYQTLYFEECKRYFTKKPPNKNIIRLTLEKLLPDWMMPIKKNEH